MSYDKLRYVHPCYFRSDAPEISLVRNDISIGGYPEWVCGVDRRDAR
jgi:hypothetical protein